MLLWLAKDVFFSTEDMVGQLGFQADSPWLPGAASRCEGFFRSRPSHLNSLPDNLVNNNVVASGFFSIFNSSKLVNTLLKGCFPSCVDYLPRLD